jgi:2-oxo-4-hydroxy-4-carboxy-5-ureidoimidazoline decarboxylase
VTLDELNALDAPAAARELRRCCGSRRWVDRMTAARPFDSAEAMAATADAVWWSLDRADWLEAFAAHPRIGEIGSGGLSGSHESGWAAREQAGVASAPASVHERLAAANREHDARFGYIFIVCATGKSADEMLAMLEQRLTNDPEAELRIAAEEQRKITQLRLSKLLT